uniref:Uncharacterized protein n=1 Tax=Isometrus maculatus TaxID=497827 RepID=A0A0U1SPJ3_ISOMC|nr:hypothetical protein [Isometrus maculatus]
MDGVVLTSGNMKFILSGLPGKLVFH